MPGWPSGPIIQAGDPGRADASAWVGVPQWAKEPPIRRPSGGSITNAPSTVRTTRRSPRSRPKLSAHCRWLVVRGRAGKSAINRSIDRIRTAPPLQTTAKAGSEEVSGVAAQGSRRGAPSRERRGRHTKFSARIPGNRVNGRIFVGGGAAPAFDTAHSAGRGGALFARCPKREGQSVIRASSAAPMET